LSYSTQTLTRAQNGSRQNKQHPKALHSQEVLMCIHEDRSHDCADSGTDSSSDKYNGVTSQY